MIADKSKHSAPKRISIRPRMFDSPESASLWFDIFNGVLFAGALLVTVGTWGTIKTAGIKERFSDERIAANEAETKRAIADSDAAKEGTAKANERIAELSAQSEQLRKDTAEAQAQTKRSEVKLAQLRKLAERRALVDMEGFLDRLKGAPKCHVEIWYLRDAPDARWLADMISMGFAEAGWGMVPIQPIPDLDPSSEAYRRGQSNVEAAGGQASGVTVASRLTTHDSAQAVMRALSRGMQSLMSGSMGDVPVPEGTIRIVIGRKSEPIFFEPEELDATPPSKPAEITK
jgi:hypothetical protein